MTEPSHAPTRRTTLAIAAAASLPLLSQHARAQSAAPGPAPALPHGACMVTPSSIEGPYYFDDRLARSAIAEGKSGIPLQLRLQVIGADCHPIAGARVDLWQADSQGVYSGFAGQGDRDNIDTHGKTYLRGTQMTDAAGQVTFATLYPGWYRGRTPHIHAKVWLDQATVLNMQMYLPDALNEFIYTQVAAYRRDVQRDTINANDLFLPAAAGMGMLNITERAHFYDASLVMAVDPNARPLPFGRPGFRPNMASGRPPGMIGPRPKHDAQGRILATPALPPATRMRMLVPVEQT